MLYPVFSRIQNISIETENDSITETS